MNRRLDNYELDPDQKLDDEGLFEAYRARDLKENRPVLLKILKEDYARDPEIVKRFREYYGNFLCNLRKPQNLAEIYNTGEIENQAYIAQEQVEGQTLEDYLAGQPQLTAQDFKPLFKQVCDGLHSLHLKNLCHYRLLPRNILITPQHTVKIIGAGSLYLALGNKALIGQLTGPYRGFIAPEILRGDASDRIDSTCDIYSLGRVIGALPLRTDSAVLDGAVGQEPASRFRQARVFFEKFDALFMAVEPEAETAGAPETAETPEKPAGTDVIRLAERDAKPNSPDGLTFKLGDAAAIAPDASVRVLGKLPKYSSWDDETLEFCWKPGQEHIGLTVIKFEVTAGAETKIYELPIKVKAGIVIKPGAPAPPPPPAPEKTKPPAPPAKPKAAPPRPAPAPPKPRPQPRASGQAAGLESIIRAFSWRYNLLLLLVALVGIVLFVPDIVLGVLGVVILEGLFLLVASSSRKFMAGLENRK
jgi:serine/threonine protein kinase